MATRKGNNISVYPDTDIQGRDCVRIEKKRGKLTLDEIIAAARSWDEDFYFILVNATDTEDGNGNYEEESPGDNVTLYHERNIEFVH